MHDLCSGAQPKSAPAYNYQRTHALSAGESDVELRTHPANGLTKALPAASLREGERFKEGMFLSSGNALL